MPISIGATPAVLPLIQSGASSGYGFYGVNYNGKMYAIDQVQGNSNVPLNVIDQQGNVLSQQRASYVSAVTTATPTMPALVGSKLIFTRTGLAGSTVPYWYTHVWELS